MAILQAVAGPGHGHGECFIWNRGDGTDVIAIDAGGAASVGQAAGGMRPEVLILSHDDEDHIAGAVSLIQTASESLRELWVPVEWAILIKHLAEARPDDQTPPLEATPSTQILALMIAVQLQEANAASGDGASAGITIESVRAAQATLSRLFRSSDSGQYPTTRGAPPRGGDHRYGAPNVRKIIDRVIKRARPLAEIFDAALEQRVQIRFFSIDLALASTARTWETAGRKGVATLANAKEAPFWQAVQIPPGIPYTYGLAQLTVQNRRALCTLLWGQPQTTSGSVVIWSDTDGNWLDTLSPRGFVTVTKSLLASSAPHHGSRNPQHDRVWTELKQAPTNMIMLCAGGRGNQRYRAEYLNLGTSRCCTWCRGSTAPIRHPSASGGGTQPMRLACNCSNVH